MMSTSRQVDTQIITTPIVLLRSLEVCGACEKYTPVHAIGAFCKTSNRFLVMSYIDDLSLEVKNAIPTDVTEFYYDDHSTEQTGIFLLNHCVKCKGIIEDSLLHTEPEDAFVPVESEDLNYIDFYTLPVSGEFTFSSIEHTSSLYAEKNILEKLADHFKIPLKK